ncbi:MAG: hypothetical protein ACOCZ7_01750, partial [Armatimonadota bacterium]
LDGCSVNTLTAQDLSGGLSFTACDFAPEVQELEDGEIYALDSTLGTRFTNCTVHAPVVGEEAQPALVDSTGFLQINGPVRHYHLNTALGNGVLDYCDEAGIELTPEFIDDLKAHHALEQ